MMVEREALIPQRTRKIEDGFAWIPHRFVRERFWTSLTRHELLLYLFLVTVSDRKGLSFYSYDKICSLILLTLDEYILARDGLIDKDLIAFDGHLFQVLSLPDRPVRTPARLLKPGADMLDQDPAAIERVIKQSLGLCTSGHRDDSFHYCHDNDGEPDNG
jgi:hypothetical protein